jgi:putative hemolysin
LDIGWQLKLILLFILILSSAFFSGSEVALFSLDRNKLDLNSSKSIIDRYLINLLDAPKRLLVTILVGNTIINVGASILAVSIALDIINRTGASHNLVFTLQIISVTILIVIIGELFPKVLAFKKPLSFSRFAAVPLFWINIILFPVAETLNELIRLIAAGFKLKKSSNVIRYEDIGELAKRGGERGNIIEEEQELIHGLVSFRSLAVHEIMTPRVDITAVSEDTQFSELLEIITSAGHSRLPLYKDDLDQITGIIYAKDILPLLKDPEMRINMSLASLARKAMFIPDTKMISSLMQEFQEKKMHIAIVVDEYGGTAGLITLEDIIEEIIGEIRDEYDKEEDPVKKITDTSWLVLGKLPIDELNELLDLNIRSEEDDFETVGGFILNFSGNIPKEGYSFQYEGCKFTVKEILKKRIQRVLVEKNYGDQ